MGKKIIIKDADFGQNGFNEPYSLDFYAGGFESDGSYNSSKRRARSNENAQTMPILVITDTTSAVIGDTENLRWAYCIRNADNSPYDVSGLSSWRSTKELSSAELANFIGKYLVLVVKFTDERNITKADLEYIKSNIYLL